jgi:hypothetical protein
MTRTRSSLALNSEPTATTVTNLEMTELLYDALRAPLGTVIQTEDPERLRQRLYAIRKESDDFAALSFVISPLNGLDLWIVNKGASNADE